MSFVFPKIIRLFLCMFACSLLIQCTQTQEDIFGNPVDLNQHNQKWLVINYWAHWCKPCLAEFSIFNHFSEIHSNQVIIVGINYDHLPLAKQRQIVLQNNIHYPLLPKDIRKIYKLPTPTVLPTTYLISPDSKKTLKLEGPQTEASLKKALGFS